MAAKFGRVGRISRRGVIGGAAAFAAGAAWAQDADDEAAAIIDVPEYAREWRFIDGPGVVGVMDLARNPNTTLGRAIGVFALQVDGKGVFEGLFNTRPGGLSLLGIFWREGELDFGVVQGFLDVSAPTELAIARATAAGVDAPAPPGIGAVQFTDGSPDIEPVTAR